MLLPTTFKQLKKKKCNKETCSLFQNPLKEKIITCTDNAINNTIFN